MVEIVRVNVCGVMCVVVVVRVCAGMVVCVCRVVYLSELGCVWGVWRRVWGKS